MRLKKTFAGFVAAAMMLCALSVPAFAAENMDEATPEDLEEDGGGPVPAGDPGQPRELP